MRLVRNSQGELENLDSFYHPPEGCWEDLFYLVMRGDYDDPGDQIIFLHFYSYGDKREEYHIRYRLPLDHPDYPQDTHFVQEDVLAGVSYWTHGESRDLLSMWDIEELVEDTEKYCECLFLTDFEGEIREKSNGQYYPAYVRPLIASIKQINPVYNYCLNKHVTWSVNGESIAWEALDTAVKTYQLTPSTGGKGRKKGA